MEPIQIELPTFFEIMTVNAWLFLEPEPTLVDCGEMTEKSWDALVKGLNDNGLAIKDLKRVIITHGHLDHMGMAKRITQNSDAMIWVNEYLYPWAVDLKTMLDRRSEVISNLMTPNLPEELFKKEFSFGYELLAPLWEEIPKDRLVVFPMEGSLEFGGAEWEIIYTPGHCYTQTCFFNPKNGHFLSADMLLKIIPNPIIDAIQQPPYSRVKSLVMHLESYQKISKLNISKTFPGHFNAFDNAQEVIAKQLQKISQRKEKCFELIQNGMHQFLDLTNAIYPNRINAATLFMVIGLIDILQTENRIKIVEKEGKYWYYEKE